MKLLKNFKTLLIFLFLLVVQISNAQNETPQWIEMMEDPNVNYHEAIKNFEEYWADKEKPMEEKEIFKTKKTLVKDYKSKRTLQYAFEYKKFQNWRKKILPFVQEDGHILNNAERLELWKKEKNNRN